MRRFVLGLAVLGLAACEGELGGATSAAGGGGAATGEGGATSSSASSASSASGTSTAAGTGGDSTASATGSGGDEAVSSASASTGTGGDGGSGGAPPVVKHGLRAEYFSGFYDRVIDKIEPTLNHDWVEASPGAGVPADRFSARWTGRLVSDKTGSHTIVTRADDGIRVWVEGKLIVDNWKSQSVTTTEAKLDLVADKSVGIRVEYFELTGGATAKLAWKTPGATKDSIIPTENLLPADAASTKGGPKPPYVNPVMPYDCPDPGVIATDVGGKPSFVAACTGGSFPLRKSRSLVDWSWLGADLIPGGKLPWSANGYRNWAPEIHKVGSKFVAYYTTVNGADKLSIGLASATKIEGPYKDRGSPLVQHPQGVIDANLFVDDDGTPYLYYKFDGNSVGKPTPIVVRQMTKDGLNFAPGSGEPTMLVNQPGTWEGGVIEASWVVKRNGWYYMFYSGNVYDERYRTGVARAKSVLGPWERHPNNPILRNNERWVGPGHGSVIAVNGKDYFVYHAWTNNGAGGKVDSAGRHVLVDRIQWVNGWPKIHDGTPSRTPQPWPGE